ncbi:DUF4391 domain-containing protein [Eubacteriaceae bacterium ES2]|nr:DUF4391 domain-containing protein [Eubacteriaceae bacterium ES2]
MKFPQKSMISQIIPQERFIANLNIASNLRKVFIDTVGAITLLSSLNTETIFVHRGDHVKHINIIEVLIHRQALNPQIIDLIHQEIAGYTIFIIRYEEWAQLWCRDLSEHGKYHQTSWQPYEDLALELSGYDLDQIYLNCYRLITGDVRKHFKNERTINPIDQIASESLVSSVNDGMLENKRLEAKIKELEREISESKDFVQTVKLSLRVHLLKEELEDLKKNQKLAKVKEEADVFAQEVETDAAVQNRMQFNTYRRIKDISF